MAELKNSTTGSSKLALVVEEDNTKKPTPAMIKRAVLTTVVCILAAGTIVFMITTILFVTERNRLTNEADSICLSEQCIKSASMYLSSMNADQDPCDNFYEYACGNWMKQRVIPDGRWVYGTLSVMNDELLVMLKELIERDPEDNQPESFKQARDLYGSCIDIDTIDDIGKKPLTDLLDSIGGWPVLGNNSGGNWDSNDFDFEELLANLTAQFGVRPVISVFVGNDDKNLTERVIKINEPWFVVPGFEHRQDNPDPVISLIQEEPIPDNDYWRNVLLAEEYSKARKAYLEYMVDIVTALAVNNTNATEEMTEVVEFEVELAKFEIPSSDRPETDGYYYPTTLEELGTDYPEIDWKRFFQLVMPASVDPPVTMSERIINRSPDYFVNMTKWFNTFDNNRVKANYMIWQLVSKMVPYLGQPFIDIRKKYLYTAYSRTSTDRWKKCISLTNGLFGFVTSRMYVDEYFPESDMEMILEMILNIKEAFKSILDTNDWLQEEDREASIEKLDKMGYEYGYPDWMKDDGLLDLKYADLVIHNDSFFNNALVKYKWSTNKNLASLRLHENRTIWFIYPAFVNAFYAYRMNQFLIPVGILQPPMFHSELPWYSNYGAIGVIIGHEMTHGFENGGRKYDKDGNLTTWWSQNSTDDFLDRAACIIDQYSSFEMPENGRNLNGNRTQNDNIADIAGVKQSYKAYKDNIPKQQRLPGLDLTEDQMFFLTYAQIWCGFTNSDGVDFAIDYGVHSPGRFRVIGPLQNSKEFSEAFNCPANSYMNPDEKCNLW